MSTLLTVRSTPLIKHLGASRLYGFDFGPLIGSAGALTGTPTVTVTPTTDPALTATDPQVNGSAFTDPDGVTSIGVGQGVLVTLAGGLAGQEYRVTVTCSIAGGGTEAVTCLVRVEDR
jgi:hypothetical protein